ncbi:hypothetical protein H0H93_002540 [Arthromyces matolae]|nr:hypothetical protein H0H93_002540 [Arthromyces matolae]
MRFSLARLWPSPPRQAPELVHESGSDDDDDDPLNTPHSSSKRPSPQVRVVEPKTVPMGEIYLDEDSPFINRNIDEVPQTLPSSGSKYRELLYVAKVEDLTETLKQVSEESKEYQEELDQERKSNTLEMARVQRQLEEERKELEAVKARLLEERTRREAVEAEVDRLRVLLDDEQIAHGETKAELELVRVQLDRAQNEEEEGEGDEDDSELRGYFYRSASEVFAAKAPMGSVSLFLL